MLTFTSVVANARFSWQANYTIGDDRWRLKQLHRLYDLLMENRDELVLDLCQVPGYQEVFENDLAMLVRIIHQHIFAFSQPSTTKCVDLVSLRKLEATQRPLGVHLIVSLSRNPLRYMLAPLAASIAAGNVTIVATKMHANDHATRLLSKLWAKYLDPDCSFLVSEFQESQLIDAEVDHITIYGDSSVPGSSIFSSSKTTYHDISARLNLLTITKGKKTWDRVAEEIYNASGNHLSGSDHLHAIFVREEDNEALQKALRRDPSVLISNGKSNNHEPFSFEMSSPAQLESQLAVSMACGLLLIVPVQSLDAAIDLMISLPIPIKQLAVLGPEAEAFSTYASKWLDVAIVSVGSIYDTALSEPVIIHRSGSMSDFISSRSFSKQVVVVRDQPSRLIRDISGIRATYKGLIPPLKPEPRGERIGFFTQVEYLVKGIGAMIGVAAMTGIFWGVRFYRKAL